MNLKNLYKEERHDITAQALAEFRERLRTVSGQSKELLLQEMQHLRAASLLLEAVVDVSQEWTVPAENLSHFFVTDLAKTTLEDRLPPPPALWLQLPLILQKNWPFTVNAILLYTPHEDIIERAKQLASDQRISHMIEQIPLLPVWNAEFINQSGQAVFTLVYQSEGWGVGQDHLCPWRRCLFTPQGDLADLCKHCAETTDFLHHFLAHLIASFQKQHSG
jgi:hypothetical protein